MKVLANTNGISQEDWRKIRNESGVGGSEVSIIMGRSPWKSVLDLYKEKIGEKELEEVDNDYVFWGKAIEPLLRKRFTVLTGKPVRQKHAIMYNPDDMPFMIADFDGIVTEPDGSKAILEIKTATQFKREEWMNGIPEYYVDQCMAYLAVSGYRKCYVICLIGGNEVVIREVYRDEERIAEIREKVSEFWHCVQKRIEPSVDGSSATTSWLADAYKDSNGQTVELPEELLPVFDEYDSIVEEMDKLSLKKEEICNKFRNYLKNNEVGVVAGRKIKWKTVKSSRLNSKKLKEDNPQLYENYLCESQYRRLQIA